MLQTAIIVAINCLTSFSGVLTVVVLLFLVGRLGLSKCRESYGKESHRYLRVKLITGAFYLIVTINAVAVIWRHYLVGNLTKFITQPEGRVSYLILLLVYIILLSFVIETKYVAASSTISLAFLCAMHKIGYNLKISEAHYDDGFHTLIFIGAVALAFMVFACHLVQSNQVIRAEQATRSRESSEKPNAATSASSEPHSCFGFLLGALWLGSVILAYIAGEFSLLPKAQEYIKSRFASSKVKKAAKSQNPDDTETTALIVYPASHPASD